VIVNSAGREFTGKEYDKFYRKDRKDPHSTYSLAPEQTPYAEIWRTAVDWIRPQERIADFGCGSGQFAHMAIAAGRKYVLGVDFSGEAINWSRNRNPGYDTAFRVGNLCDPLVFAYAEYDVAVLLETLEHILGDLSVLASVPVGKRVILSVPCFPCASHVRYFESQQAVIDRYQPLVRIRRISEHFLGRKVRSKVIWLLSCLRVQR
jgi:SAM-dependent methyltransferase